MGRNTSLEKSSWSSACLTVRLVEPRRLRRPSCATLPSDLVAHGAEGGRQRLPEALEIDPAIGVMAPFQIQVGQREPGRELPGEAVASLDLPPLSTLAGIHAHHPVLELTFRRLILAHVETHHLLAALPLGAIEHQPEIVPAEVERHVQEFIAAIGAGRLETQEGLVPVEFHLPSRRQVSLEGMAVEGVFPLEWVVGEQSSRARHGQGEQVQARIEHLPEGELCRLERAEQARVGIAAAQGHPELREAALGIENRVEIRRQPKEIPRGERGALDPNAPIRIGRGLGGQAERLVHHGHFQDAVRVRRSRIGLRAL